MTRSVNETLWLEESAIPSAAELSPVKNPKFHGVVDWFDVELTIVQLPPSEGVQ